LSRPYTCVDDLQIKMHFCFSFRVVMLHSCAIITRKLEINAEKKVTDLQK
jgi:hypothetical protein